VVVGTLTFDAGLPTEAIFTFSVTPTQTSTADPFNGVLLSDSAQVVGTAVPFGLGIAYDDPLN
jgi:hypothetical protein